MYAPLPAVGLLRRKRGLPLSGPGPRRPALHPRRAAGRRVASNRERGGHPGRMAPAVEGPRRRRSGDAPARGPHGRRARGDERELLHRHRPPPARHRRSDRVPPGHRARGSGHANASKRGGARPRGRRRLCRDQHRDRGHTARHRPRVRERRALRLLHRRRPPRGPKPRHRRRRRPRRRDAGSRRRGHAPRAGRRPGAHRSPPPVGGHRGRRDVVGHPVHLRPARHGPAAAADLCPARLAPARHRNCDRPRRAGPGAERHGGRRSGARRGRRRASPGAPGDDYRGRCSGRRPRSPWS